MDIRADDSAYLMDGIEEKIHRWLVDLTYWYGWKRGFTAYKEEGNKPQPPGMDFFLAGWEAQPVTLEFRWYTSYNHYYLTLKDCRNDSFSNIILSGKRLDEIVAIHRNDAEKIQAPDGVKLAERLEGLIKKFFPGIRQVNGLRICPSPAHYYNHPPVPDEFHLRPHLAVCRRIGGTWVCESCMDQFGLGEDNAHAALPLKKHQNEILRLTPERKFATLQRDQFTCQKCGNSAVNTHDIQLRVKHIIPVTEGGKTTPDNLTTVCSECI